jgi:hypothetical protein
MALPWRSVSKITNSKHQITNKSQILNSKLVQSDCFFVWDFEFGHWYLFVFWSLFFEISLMQ